MFYNTERDTSYDNAQHNRKVPNGCALSKETVPCPAVSHFDHQAPFTISLCLEESGAHMSGLPTESTVYRLSRDPRYDMFQVGRAVHSTNDFVVPGQIHEEIDGLMKGPVSRHACRILCERLPPYRCFIYAGGFDQAKVSLSYCERNSF